MRRAQRDAWLRRVDVEMDNLRAVVAWSSSGADDGQAVVRIVCALGFLYWRIRGHVREGYHWGELALAAPAAQASPPDRMQPLASTGGIAAFMNRLVEARAWLQEGVRLGRESTDRATLGFAPVLLGFTESHLGESTAACRLREGISILRALAARNELLLVLNVAIAPFVVLTDFASARAALDESLALAGALGDNWAIGVALSSAAFQDIREHQWQSAATRLEQALDLDRPVLSGWSYGPLVILDYIRQYGEEALGGINFVGDISKLGSNEAMAVIRPEVRSLVPGFFATDLQESVRSLESLVRLFFVNEPSEDERYLMLGYSLAAPAAVRQALFSRSFDNDDVMTRIRVPVLLTHGALDAVVDVAVVDQHKALMPHAQLRVVPDAGHALFWENVEAFNAQLRAFCHAL